MKIAARKFLATSVKQTVNNLSVPSGHSDFGLHTMSTIATQTDLRVNKVELIKRPETILQKADSPFPKEKLCV